MRTLSKDEILVLKHGLDVMCKSEGAALGQGGLSALNPANVGYLSARLATAVQLAGVLDEEYQAIVAAEESDEKQE